MAMEKESTEFECLVHRFFEDLDLVYELCHGTELKDLALLEKLDEQMRSTHFAKARPLVLVKPVR